MQHDVVTSAKTQSARTGKHRKTHRLVQAWVSPELKKALIDLAKSEGRTLANFVRRKLGEIAGVAE